MNAPVFHFPSDVRYDCLRHGVCCRGSREIAVDPPAVERIQACDWRSMASLPASARSPFRRMHSSLQGVCLARGADGACAFLDGDGLCRLQKRHGADFKPRNCRSFPFRVASTPDGLFVGVSFQCESVLAGTGRPIAEHADDIRGLVEREPAVCKAVEDPVRLDAATPIAWRDYVALEAALDAILAREERPLAECLRAGHAWLGMLRVLISQARILPPEAVSALIARYAEDGRSNGYERAFRIARRHAPNATLKRMLIGTFTAFRHGLGPRQWRLWAIARVLAENVRHWTRFGALRFVAFDVRIPYHNFRTAEDDLAGEAPQRLLRRYLRHAIFRKDLIADTDLFWGYSYLVLVHGLVQWHAAALRAAGRPDPALALATVERDFVRHTSFSGTFLYHPAMADFIRRYFNKPNFAHVVTQD